MEIKRGLDSIIYLHRLQVNDNPSIGPKYFPYTFSAGKNSAILKTHKRHFEGWLKTCPCWPEINVWLLNDPKSLI